MYDARFVSPRRPPFPAVHETADRHEMTDDREEGSMVVIAYRQFLRGALALKSEENPYSSSIPFQSV